MTELKSWVKQNSTLVYFLIAQFIALGAGAASMLAYMVKLETRVSIMETRGASYTADRLGKIDDRITILEQHVKANEDTTRRIVEIMTRELGKPIK